MSPLRGAVDRRSSAAVMIARCRSPANGTPKWWPMRNGTNTARGGLTRSVTSRATVTETVGMPRRSIARWTSPTDWWQIGQAGARSAISAASATTASAMSSARVRSSSCGSML